MRYRALATDYDGTLAREGVVPPEVLGALQQARASGRKLILVTGRRLDHLFQVFSHPDVFDSIVAENGALLYQPATGDEKALAAGPPDALLALLAQRGVKPLDVGRVVVATLQTQERPVLQAIRSLGLDLEVTLNKGSVMVLPAGVNKGSGLRAALAELRIASEHVVAIGDAENDHPFLAAAGCGIAVAGAVPILRETADWVTQGDAGAGVVEVITRLLEDDLRSIDRRRC